MKTAINLVVMAAIKTAINHLGVMAAIKTAINLSNRFSDDTAIVICQEFEYDDLSGV